MKNDKSKNEKVFFRCSLCIRMIHAFEIERIDSNNISRF
jgi:hypothetical protein